MTEIEATTLFLDLQRVVLTRVGEDRASDTGVLKFLDMLAFNLYLLGDDDET